MSLHIYEKEAHTVCNGTKEISKSPELNNYILVLYTGYLEAGVVHTAWHKIGDI